jgi:biotin carboxylase
MISADSDAVREALVVLSGTPLNRGVVDAARNLGLAVVLIDRNESVPLDCDRRIRADALDSDRILGTLHAMTDLRIVGAYTSTDIAIPSANQINREFTGRAVDPRRLREITSKTAMMAAWQRDGLAHRRSVAVREFRSDLQGMCDDGPVLVKPCRSSSSRGVTILAQGAGDTEMCSAMEHARSQSADGMVLIEDFVHGSEHSIELLGDGDGNVAVYGVSTIQHSRYAAHTRIAVRLHYNAIDLPDSEQDRMAEFGRRCYRSFGLSSSLAHLEIIRTPDGMLEPVEINARSGGFIAAPLVDEVSGRSYLSDYLAMLAGDAVREVFWRSKRSSMYFFYDLPPFIRSSSASDLAGFLPSGIESHYHNRARLKPGAVFEPLTSDNDRYGMEILCGDRASLTREAVEAAERRFMEHFYGMEVVT